MKCAISKPVQSASLCNQQACAISKPVQSASLCNQQAKLLKIRMPEEKERAQRRRSEDAEKNAIEGEVPSFEKYKLQAPLKEKSLLRNAQAPSQLLTFLLFVIWVSAAMIANFGMENIGMPTADRNRFHPIAKTMYP